jgi:hypothetical protein
VTGGKLEVARLSARSVDTTTDPRKRPYRAVNPFVVGSSPNPGALHPLSFTGFRGAYLDALVQRWSNSASLCSSVFSVLPSCEFFKVLLVWVPVPVQRKGGVLVTQHSLDGFDVASRRNRETGGCMCRSGQVIGSSYAMTNVTIGIVRIISMRPVSVPS